MYLFIFLMNLDSNAYRLFGVEALRQTLDEMIVLHATMRALDRSAVVTEELERARTGIHNKSTTVLAREAPTATRLGSKYIIRIHGTYNQGISRPALLAGLASHLSLPFKTWQADSVQIMHSAVRQHLNVTVILERR